MVICRECEKQRTCSNLCDDVSRELNGNRSKALTNEELISYTIFALNVAGLDVMQILQAARMVAKIPKSTAYRELNHHKTVGRTMVDYFMLKQSRLSLLD